MMNKIEEREEVTLTKINQLIEECNNSVKLSGNQTVSGAKKFSSNFTVIRDDPAIICAHSTVEKGTNPTSNSEYWGLNFNDKNGNGTNYKIGAVSTSVTKEGQTQISLCAYNYVANTNTEAKIAVIYPKNGTPYTYAPTPASNSNGTQIATTAFVNTAISSKANTADVVALTGNQTIAGTKTFSGTIKASANPFIRSFTGYGTPISVLRTTSESSSQDIITVSEPEAGSTYGQVVKIGGKGVTIIGSGESPTSCMTENATSTNENTYITADSSIYFYTGANTYANKKITSIDTNGKLSSEAVTCNTLTVTKTLTIPGGEIWIA